MDTLFDVSLFSIPQYPEFEIRGDDYELNTCLDFFRITRNEGKIYAALLRLASGNVMTNGKNNHKITGKNNSDGSWTVRVGYTDLCQESGCTTRALGRAWPRLESLGFLTDRERHNDRRAARYTIRSIELLDSIYRRAGCTHFRVMPDKSLQPFRTKPSSLEQGAQ